MSKIIKNGTIVTAGDIFTGDIYVDEGIIKDIGINLEKDCDEVIDAGGKYVIQEE